ncbi:MAG: hypothetical protein ABGY22_05180 [Acidimicrobiales bacterium]
MSMQESYCKQMRLSGPESLSLKDQVKFDVLLQIEVLSGCEHSCTGCFVNKHGDESVVDGVLSRAKELSDSIKTTGLNLREFVIGPTDFFSASNTNYILNHSITQSIMSEHTGARIATPAKFDLTSDERFQEIFDILDDSDKYRDNMIIEFVTPIESYDTMVNDDEYFERVMKRVDFFKNHTPKQMDWSWTLQSSAILGRKIDKSQYTEILNKSINDYETILEMNPAFARAPAHKQKDNLIAWNNFLSTVIDKDNCNNATISMANLYCNSMNFMGLTILQGEHEVETHLNVMLHEQAFFPKNDRTNVTGLNFNEILDRRDALITEGINKFSSHPLYKDSPYIIALASRLVWEAIVSMELDETESVLPMDVLSLFNPTEQGDHLWNDDALIYMNMKEEAA